MGGNCGHPGSYEAAIRDLETTVRWEIPAYAGMTSIAGMTSCAGMTLSVCTGFRLGGWNDVVIRHSGLDPESINVSLEPGECRFARWHVGG
jgi:hypothetical protein